MPVTLTFDPTNADDCAYVGELLGSGFVDAARQRSRLRLRQGGHRADRSEAARDRGRRARRDSLFVFLSGLAQVRVEVYEAGRDDEPRRVEDLDALGCRLTAAEQSSHATVFNQDVAAAVHILRAALLGATGARLRGVVAA